MYIYILYIYIIYLLDIQYLCQIIFQRILILERATKIDRVIDGDNEEARFERRLTPYTANSFTHKIARPAG